MTSTTIGLVTSTVFGPDATTTVISGPIAQHDDESTIVAAGTVVGFILLGLTGVLLFLKISRWIRIRRENQRFIEWNRSEHGGKHPKGRHAPGSYYTKGKNAFDVIEDDEGIPA